MPFEDVGRLKIDPSGWKTSLGDGLTLNQQIDDLTDVRVLQLDDLEVLRAVACPST